jgi:hypothetical protein
MSYKPNWSNGEWLTICDACGRKFKDSALRMRWDGLMVCSGDWEVRQPQDYVRGVADIQAPPYVRPEQQDHFIPLYFDKAFDESVDVTEDIAKTATKIFGGRVLATSSAINGTYLNNLGLNAVSYEGTDPESIELSETVLLILGRTVSETLSLSESVTPILLSPTALNGSVLNSLGLD